MKIWFSSVLNFNLILFYFKFKFDFDKSRFQNKFLDLRSRLKIKQFRKNAKEVNTRYQIYLFIWTYLR